MNNQTWGLLDKEDRSEQDNIRMINFAKASLYHWRQSDKYGIVNEQRGTMANITCLCNIGQI